MADKFVYGCNRIVYDTIWIDDEWALMTFVECEWWESFEWSLCGGDGKEFHNFAPYFTNFLLPA